MSPYALNMLDHRLHGLDSTPLLTCTLADWAMMQPCPLRVIARTPGGSECR